MEKLCSVCGSPMNQTANGYKCSFCGREEQKTAQSGYINETVNMSGNGKSHPTIPVVVGVVVGILFLILCMSVVPTLVVMDMVKPEGDIVSPPVEQTGKEDVNAPVKVPELPDGFRSYTIQQAVEKIFGKPAEQVTEEELNSIRYLEFEMSWIQETCVISYSMADYRDYEPDYCQKIEDMIVGNRIFYNDAFEETIQTIDVGYYNEKNDAVYGDLAHFRGVNVLKLDSYRYVSLANFPNLLMLDVGGTDISEVVKMNLPVSKIEVLKASRNDLTGLEAFTSLKTLYLEGNQIVQLEQVAKCTQLENLYCNYLKDGMNFTPIKTLTNLKTLYIDGSSDGVKDLSVIGSLTNLENLTIKDTDILNLDFAKNLTKLKTLRLSENGELRGFDAFSELDSLEFLEFNINYLHGGQPEYAGLGKLKNLKSLALHTVYDLDFLYELDQLEELEIRLTFYDDIMLPIYQMKNLKKLTLAQCNSQYKDGLEGLKELTQLRTLIVDDMEFRYAVDCLFALEGVEELRITSTAFGEPPTQITPSENLKVLDLTGVRFLKPWSGTSWYMADKDPEATQVVFNAYCKAPALEELYCDYAPIADWSGLSNLKTLKVLSLHDCDLTEVKEADIKNCTQLEVLYLSRNQVSDISFVSHLPHLKYLYLKDCYVTDLTPLLNCSELVYVDARNNPISENPLVNVTVVEGSDY